MRQVELSEQLNKLCGDALAYPGANWEDLAHIMEACRVFLPQPFPPTFWLVLFSLIVALLAVYVNWQVTLKRATFDAIESSETTHTYRIARQTYQHYVGHDPRALGLIAGGSVPREQRVAVVDFFNHFEAFGAGVTEHILSRRHVRRVLLDIMTNAWIQGAFFIYQMRYRRDPITRRLQRKNGEPIYDPEVFIEFENLVREFGINAEFFPPQDGRWDRNKEQLRKMAEILRIQAPTNQTANSQTFNELLEDLAKLTTPLEPEEMKTIGENTAYQPDVSKSSNVLPEPKPTDDPQIQRIETTLADIKTALGHLRDAVQALAKPGNQALARTKPSHRPRT